MDSKTCRICHEGVEPLPLPSPSPSPSPSAAITNCRILPGSELIAPCGCSGTMQWVHRECLNAWRYHSLMQSQEAAYTHGLAPELPLWRMAQRRATEQGWWDLAQFDTQGREPTRQPATTTVDNATSIHQALDFFQLFLGLGQAEQSASMDIDTLLHLQSLHQHAKVNPFLACTVCQTSYKYVEPPATKSNLSQQNPARVPDHDQASLQKQSTRWLARMSRQSARIMIGGPRRRILCSVVAVYLLVAILGHFLSLLSGSSGGVIQQSHAAPCRSSLLAGCQQCWWFELPLNRPQSEPIPWLYQCLLMTSLFIARLPALLGCLALTCARHIAPAPASLALACRLVSVVELAFGPMTQAGRLAHYTLLSLFMIAWSVKSWTDQYCASSVEPLHEAMRISAADPILFSLTIHALSILALDASLTLKALDQKMSIRPQRLAPRVQPQEQPLYYWNIQSVSQVA